MLDGSSIAKDKRIVVDGQYFLQVGALVYRLNQNALEYLLITSRRSKRWIIPKGWPMIGKSLAQAAMQEAYEEAGACGCIDVHSIGSYNYNKTRMLGDVLGTFSVMVFPMLYSHQEKNWPEKHQRNFAWLKPEEAARKVREKQLKTILKSFSPH